jgi:hypothetical protein
MVANTIWRIIPASIDALRSPKERRTSVRFVVGELLASK